MRSQLPAARWTGLEEGAGGGLAFSLSTCPAPPEGWPQALGQPCSVLAHPPSCLQLQMQVMVAERQARTSLRLVLPQGLLGFS